MRVWARDADAKHSFALLYETQSHEDAAREFVHDGPFWSNGPLLINVVTWEGDLDNPSQPQSFSLWTCCQAGRAELIMSSAEYRRGKRKKGCPSTE